MWDLKVHYLVQESQIFVPMLSQINPVYALPPYCFKLQYMTSSTEAVRAFRLIKYLTVDGNV